MLKKDEKKQISYIEYNYKFVRTETEIMTCDKCNTSYPIIDGKIMCNGHSINKCLCEVY